MKSKFLFFSAFLLLFIACEKSDDNPDTLKRYFTISQSEFVNKEWPVESTSNNAPLIRLISGNSRVIDGGSNPLAIYSNADYSFILVGVEGYKGYYKIPVDLEDSGSDDLMIVNLLMGIHLPQDNFVIRVALMNDNNEVGQSQEVEVSTINVVQGNLQISCSWDQLNDVDLHVVEPNGNETYYGNRGFSYDWKAIYKNKLGITVGENEEIYDVELTDSQEQILDNLTLEYLNLYILDALPGGNLDLDSNADCEIDSINNENITFPKIEEIQSGEYIVRVDFYSNCISTDRTHFIVTARYNGELVEPISSTNPYFGRFNTTDQDGGGEGSGLEVLRFNISNNQYKSASTEKFYGFSFPSDKNSSKKANAWTARIKSKLSVR